jgi:hypothetical protein
MNENLEESGSNHQRLELCCGEEEEKVAMLTTGEA